MSLNVHPPLALMSSKIWGTLMSQKMNFVICRLEVITAFILKVYGKEEMRDYMKSASTVVVI